MKKWVLLITGILLISLALFLAFITSPFAIKLNGKETLTIGINEKFKDPGVKTLIDLGDVPVSGKVDTKKLGTYKLEYKYFYTILNRTIKVVDKTSPVISLNGNAEVNIAIGSKYQELGYTAEDNIDGDLTSEVEVTNNIDYSKEGKYEIVYKVKDKSGNTGEVIREVSVFKNGPLAMSLKDFNLDGYFETTILKETERMDDSYINETVFYGDSITYNFGYYLALPTNVIWAKSNVTPENAHTWTVPINPHGTNMTLEAAVAKYKPKRLVISLGANAVAVMTEEYFISQYESLVEKVKKANPSTLVIVQSIFPVDAAWDIASQTRTTINNTKINRLNYLLAEMCERQKVKFLNSAVVLKDGNGQMTYGYAYASDGIHLLPVANNKVIEYFRTHAYIEGE